MRAARVDSNHAEIVKALRRVGCVVWDTSHEGSGAPDLVVMRPANGFKVYLIEIKSEKGELNKLQEKFRSEWWGQVSVVRSVDEALKVVGVKT